MLTAKSVQIHHWKTLERHPLSAAHEDVEGEIFEAMVQSIKDGHVPTITICGGRVLDGWQRYRACLKADVKPIFVAVPRDITPEDFVNLRNNLRRHANKGDVEGRLKARRERVAAARDAGKSVRSIAMEEGIPKSTVQDDLAAGVRKPEVRTQETGNNAAKSPESAQNGRVTGLDGKSHPATHPPKTKCDRCTRLGLNNPNCGSCAALRSPPKPKQGAPAWSEKGFQKDFDAAFGRLIRLVDARSHKAGKGRGFDRCHDLLGQFLEAYKAWKLETA